MDLDGEIKAKVKNTLSVLFVEDEVTITLAFTNVLKRRFKNVYKAENGEKGVEMFREFKPDIVFTDILMPRMNGLTMIAKIKELDPDVPVVIMTALTESSYLERANEMGVRSYLIKPIDEREFFTVLNDIAYDVCMKKC